MYLFYLSPSNRRTTDRLFPHANSHVLLIGSGLRLMKRKRHTLFALGLVGDLQTADLTGLNWSISNKSSRCSIYFTLLK